MNKAMINHRHITVIIPAPHFVIPAELTPAPKS